MIAAAPGATAHDLIASELHTNCLVDAINEAWREKVRRALMHISYLSIYVLKPLLFFVCLFPPC